jgi:cytochrome P450
MTTSFRSDEQLGVPAARDVPFPPEQSNFMRSLVHYRGSALKRFEEMRREYPPVAGFRVGGRSIVLVHAVEVIEEILVRKHGSFVKDAFTSEIAVVLGQGLLTTNGEQHRHQRKLVAPSFAASEVSRYAPQMFGAAAAFAERLENGQTLDVSRAMMRLTLEILVRTLFGRDFHEYEFVDRELEATMQAFRPWPELFRLLTPEWVPLPSRRRLRLARERLHGLVDRLLAQKRQSPAEDDLLSRLFAARDDERRLSHAELRDQVITLLLAGHETTALSLGYAFRLLALHPAARERVEAELGALKSPPSAEALRELEYTHAVFQETLRLFPPAWVVGREALEDVVLAGFRVPKGMQVMMPIFTLHRDPRWFRDPEAFRPERFLPGGEVREGKVPRFAYLPFGAGPHVCVGSHFALLEAMAIFAGVLTRVRFVARPDARFELAPAITLRPRYPIVLGVEPR